MERETIIISLLFIGFHTIRDNGLAIFYQSTDFRLTASRLYTRHFNNYLVDRHRSLSILSCHCSERFDSTTKSSWPFNVLPTLLYQFSSSTCSRESILQSLQNLWFLFPFLSVRSTILVRSLLNRLISSIFSTLFFLTLLSFENEESFKFSSNAQQISMWIH